jgi:hypothetical protein
VGNGLRFVSQISDLKSQISNTKSQTEQSRPDGHAVKRAPWHIPAKVYRHLSKFVNGRMSALRRRQTTVFIDLDRFPARGLKGFKKGSGTNSAEHPLGHLAIGS